jgi:xanthine dehydrogenase YagR molybdenum-binding subunit
VANAIYHATGVRVRDYPVTLDQLLAKIPHFG